MTLALVDPRGRPLGLLPLGTTPSPWWQEVAEVVDLAGLDVTVLRLLTADGPFPGGAVTYLAEYAGPPPAGLVRSTGDWTAPHPLRMPWAEPGGPAATLAWAAAVSGRAVTGCRQIRTWNLSSIWRLDTDAGAMWVKEVPPFFAHEGAVLRWLGRATTPRLLGADGCRLLTADIPGTDRHRASPEERIAMVADLLDIQVAAADRVAELLTLGVPDQRAEPFGLRAAEVVSEVAAGAPAEVVSGVNAGVPAEVSLSRDERAVLERFLARLPERFAELAACGVPDTLVHGDFHPGNVRSDGTSQVIMDWGDSVIGHPALDLVRMRDWREPAPGLTEVWCEFWRERVPGSEPEHAVELIEPLAALRDAVVYGGFLRSIEPAERVYHDGDALAALRRAIVLLKTSPDA